MSEPVGPAAAPPEGPIKLNLEQLDAGDLMALTVNARRGLSELRDWLFQIAYHQDPANRARFAAAAALDAREAPMRPLPAVETGNADSSVATSAGPGAAPPGEVIGLPSVAQLVAWLKEYEIAVPPGFDLGSLGHRTALAGWLRARLRGSA